MKFLFSSLILFILTLNGYSITYEIKNLDKQNNQSEKILGNYLRQTELKIEGFEQINFILGTKENISSINKSLYDEIIKFKNDAFIIKLIENNIYIIGNNQRSLLYGIYTFLERNLEYKFLTKNFEIIPQNSFVKKDNINFELEARFEYREIFIHELEDNDFALKLGLNGAFGHKVEKADDNFIAIHNSFTPYELIPLKYEQLYPEFFCAGQLDFAFDEVKQFANNSFQEKIKNLKKQHESKEIFYISHEDRLSFCQSSNSLKLIDKYNSSSAPFLDYANYIAKKNPDKNIFMEAYQWSKKAPSNFPNLEKNLNIIFSDIEADFSNPINSEINKEIYSDLISWNKYKRDIYIWHYITNFSGYFQPFPNINTTAEDIKTFAKNNQIKGVFLQGAYETNFSELANLRAWVFSKLLWNPSLDENRLIKEFSYYYYGDAYKDILNYFTLLDESVKQTNSKLLVKTSVNSKYLDDIFITKAKKILDNALKNVPKNSIYYEHINEVYVSIDYVQLLKGTISNEDKARLKSFLSKNDIKYYAENASINSLLPYFDMKRVTPSLPKIISNKTTQWLDFQEYELKLCCSEIVEDKKASSMSAARMTGDKSDWGIQLDLSSIPKGKWKIYANVRIKKSTKLSVIDYVNPALYYGVHDKGIKNFSLINTLKDEEYHEIEIASLNIENNEIGQVWIRPAASDNVEYIYVDRIFVIKE
jgi:hypothetical protein